MILYTLRQAAEQIHRDEKTTRAEIKAGRLQARKSGRSYLISDADIQSWYESLPPAKTTPPAA